MSRAIAAPEAPIRFSHFYRDHFPIAWRGLARLGVAPLDCEDAAQDVFVTAYRRWHAYEGDRERRAWLFGIVRKIAWRYRRGESRRTRRHRAYATLEPEAVCVETSAREREAWDRLRAFLELLDADKREAFVLGELEQLGRIELGAALGVNPNTAYSRLQAARRRFFEHFAALGDDGCAHVLAHAEHEPRPPEQARAGVWIALAPLVGESTAAIGGAATTAGWTWTTKLAIASVTLATIGVVTRAELGPSRRTGSDATAALATSHDDGATHDGVTAGAPPALLPDASDRSGLEPAADPTSAEEPAVPRSRGTRAPAGAVLDDADLEAEIALLIAARQAMIDGDVVAARRELSRHRTRFDVKGRLVRLRRQIERELETRVIGRGGAGDVQGQEPQ